MTTVPLLKSAILSGVVLKKKDRDIVSSYRYAAITPGRLIVAGRGHYTVDAAAEELSTSGAAGRRMDLCPALQVQDSGKFTLTATDPQQADQTIAAGERLRIIPAVMKRFSMSQRSKPSKGPFRLHLSFMSNEEMVKWRDAIVAECNRIYLPKLIVIPYPAYAKNVNEYVWGLIRSTSPAAEALRRVYLSAVEGSPVQRIVYRLHSHVMELLGPVDLKYDNEGIFGNLMAKMLLYASHSFAFRTFVLFFHPSPDMAEQMARDYSTGQPTRRYLGDSGDVEDIYSNRLDKIDYLNIYLKTIAESVDVIHENYAVSLSVPEKSTDITAAEISWFQCNCEETNPHSFVYLSWHDIKLSMVPNSPVLYHTILRHNLSRGDVTALVKCFQAVPKEWLLLEFLVGPVVSMEDSITPRRHFIIFLFSVHENDVLSILINVFVSAGLIDNVFVECLFDIAFNQFSHNGGMAVANNIFQELFFTASAGSNQPNIERLEMAPRALIILIEKLYMALQRQNASWFNIAEVRRMILFPLLSENISSPTVITLSTWLIQLAENMPAVTRWKKELAGGPFRNARNMVNFEIML